MIDERGQIDFERIDGLDAEIARELQTEGVDLSLEDAGAARLGYQGDQNSDRAAADYDGEFAGLQFTHPNVVASDRDGLDESALAQGKRIGQAMQGVGGHGPHALERAGSIDADELQVMADVAVAHAAGRTGAAGIERAHGDAISRLPAGNAGTDGGERAGHFMSHDVRQSQAVGHGAVKQMQIRAADSAVLDFDLHLAGAGRDLRAVADAQGPIAFKKCRTHMQECIPSYLV